MGRATGDTARTGPGDVNYGIADGHFGRAGDRIIYGQTVDIETLSPVDQRLLPSGVKRVVLVPWDYGADCSATPWTKSAQFIAPGRRGVYSATLRNKSHWLNGVPVLDVYSPEYAPYTGSFRNGMRGTVGNQQWLTADALFELVPLMPHPDSMKLDAQRATRPLLQWAEQHQDLAQQHPARDLVWTASSTVTSERTRRTPIDIAGTWQFTFEVENAPSRTFFARTEATPSSAWPSPGLQRERQPWEVDSVTGVYVRMALATQLDSLPLVCDPRGRTGYMSQRVASFKPNNPIGTFDGDIDARLANQALYKVPGFVEHKLGLPAGVQSFGRTEDIRTAHTKFQILADGIMRVRQEYAVSDGRRASLSAARISNTTVQCAW